MAKILNIKVVIPDGDTDDWNPYVKAGLSDAIRVFSFANGLESFASQSERNSMIRAYVESMPKDSAYQMSRDKIVRDEFAITVPEAFKDMKISLHQEVSDPNNVGCKCDPEAIKRVFVEEIAPVLSEAASHRRKQV